MTKAGFTDRIPLEAKAIAIGRWHHEALARRGAVIREFRALREIPRAMEGFWIIMEAGLAHFEGRVTTKKEPRCQGNRHRQPRDPLARHSGH